MDIDINDINPMLFDFQKDIVKWALKRARSAVFAGCGLGKTPIQLEWANHITKSGKTVLILAPLAVSQQTIHEGIKFGIKINLCSDQSDVTDGINITNYEKLGKFDCSVFGGVVLDECFPPDTPIEVFNIDKSLELRYIKDIKEGDSIFNAQGEDYVQKICKRKINRAIQVSIGERRVICSENHPFFTMYGWRSAQDLQPGDYIMATKAAVLMVRENIFPKICSAKNGEILREILLSEMENEYPRAQNKSAYQGNTSKDRGKSESLASLRESICFETTKKNCGIKPNERPLNKEEGFIEITSDESQTFRAWGEWTRDDITAANNEGCSIRQLDCGICYITGKTSTRFSTMLQSRLRKSRFENSNRDRRILSLFTKNIRQKKRHEACFVRVDSIKVLEQGHPELEKYRDAEGHIYFYDIKAKRHPSFSVNGLLVHNSSILKQFDGKTRNLIIDSFLKTPFKLACTATPSPNDYMELGNHSEFLGVMSYKEMLAMYFVHDGGDTSKWRLKKHAVKLFWEWASTWAIMMQNPTDLGYKTGQFNLPPINYHHIIAKKNTVKKGQLYAVYANTLQDQLKARRNSIHERVNKCAEMVNNTDDFCITWCNLNVESDMLQKKINGAFEIKGSQNSEYKEKTLLDFSNGLIKKLVTKSSIAGYGMNFQHCNQMYFVGLSHSFEDYYQTVRRCWRFGQKRPVDVYIIASEEEGAVVENIKRKEADFEKMQKEMIANTQKINKHNLHNVTEEKINLKTETVKSKNWELLLGDSVEEIKNIDDDSVHYSIFSPPFASLYTYSNNIKDMGNCRDTDEFLNHFTFLVKNLYRVIMPGRLLSFHCMNLPTTKSFHGFIGIQDFRGQLIKLFQDAGFIYHSEVCIWKDPVVAMQRTKALGLLWKQIQKDSSMCRQGIPDYLVTMRKPGENKERISHTKKEFPVDIWQKYASPVWMDINPSNTLQRVSARQEEDERHICPLQLEVIERALDLWTNHGDLVLDPFSGIGSTGYVSIQKKRHYKGIELKESYHEQAVKNLQRAENSNRQLSLF